MKMYVDAEWQRQRIERPETVAEECAAGVMPPLHQHAMGECDFCERWYHERGMTTGHEPQEFAMDTYEHLKQQKDEIERQQSDAKDKRIAELQAEIVDIEKNADANADELNRLRAAQPHPHELTGEAPVVVAELCPTCGHDMLLPADDLRAALVHAVEVIQTWHNMGVPRREQSDMWDIYWKNAPEMKQIREALSARGQN